MNEKKIIIRKINETTCTLYDPEDNCIGLIDNMLSFTDVRVQIKKASVSGYYIKWVAEDGVKFKIEILKSGRMAEYPNGLFDEWDNFLDEILDI